MTLKEKIEGLLIAKISEKQEELGHLCDMKNRLTSLEEEELNSYLGIVNYYLKTKKKEE